MYSAPNISLIPTFCRVFFSQGIDGLPGEKADKGAKGEAGLNVCGVSIIFFI